MEAPDNSDIAHSKSATNEATNEEYHPRQNLKVIRFLFSCLVLGQIFVNYDSGAVPSVLDEIADEFGLAETLLGILGALPYIGLIVASPFVGALMQRVSPKKLVLVTLFLNILSAGMLAASLNVWVLYISRFLIGVTQASFCIYVPVWVDEFAPEKHLTMWMGLIQGGTVFGVMIGYLVTGYVRPWRYSIVIQCGILLIIWGLLAFTPALYVDLYSPPKRPKEDRSSPPIDQMSTPSANGQPIPVVLMQPSSSHISLPTSDDSSNSRAGASLRKLATLNRLQSHRALNTVAESDESSMHVRSPVNNEATPALHEATPAFHEGTLAPPHSHSLTHTARQPSHRALTLMTPSPAGAILETLEVAANYDNPLVLRRQSTLGGSTASDPSKPRPTTLVLIRTLFASRVYIWTVVTLCALLYVVTGIQFWSTKYFITEKQADPAYVRIVFSATAATAPTAGVFLGAFIIDRIGGYRSQKGMFRALWFCFISGILATISGVVASFLDPFPAIIAMIWFLLFFGGAILPPATGILIAAVDQSVRPFASSFSMFTYNIFGYALGTFLPGPFMTAFGLNVGMKLVYFWSFFGVFGMAMAIFFAWKDRWVPREVPATEFVTLGSMVVPRRLESGLSRLDVHDRRDEP